MSESQLHLFQTRPDVRLLTAWVARRHARHEHQTSDLGDALHGLLRAAFGEVAPQPFRYLDEERGLLAYTSLDAEAMASQVALADPLAAQTLGLGASGGHEGYRLRMFPTRWPVGHVLGFEVRVRPTARGVKGEQDAFLQAVAQAGGASLQREAVYAEWFRDHLAGQRGASPQAWQGAVELLDVHLAGFQRLAIVRRSQSLPGEMRRGHVIDGPDALLRGQLRVIDSEAFAHLLKRGVGRHRSFGFGMLLLNRVD